MVRVPVAVGIAAAVDDHRIVEDRFAVDVLLRIEPLQEAREALHVIEVDLPDLLHQVLVVAMVGAVMVALGNADLRIRAIAAVAGEQERGHPRRIGLERHREQVVHHVHVFAIVRRNAGGRIGPGVRQVTEILGALDTLLDLPHAGQVLVELVAIIGAELPLKGAGVVHHEIEQRFLRGLPQAEIFLPLVRTAGPE